MKNWPVLVFVFGSIIFSTFAYSLSPISVKDRLRLDLWYNGVEEIKQNKNLLKSTTQPPMGSVTSDINQDKSSK
jgi:hypothetical protein